MKAACFTVAVLDYFSGRDESYPGGNSLNQAFAFRRAGIESAFVGALGRDEAGDRITALMEIMGIDSSHTYRKNGQTAANRIVNDEDGERFGVDGAWKGGVYESFRMSEEDWEFAAEADIWATHFDCPDFPEALKRRRGHQFLAVDMLHLMDEELLRECSGTVDVAYIGGSAEMAGHLENLSRECSGGAMETCFILTLGAEGSIAFRSGNRFVQKALPLKKVFDATGCGDAFQAACTGVLAGGGELEEALAAGAAAGGEAAGRFGGSPWETSVTA